MLCLVNDPWHDGVTRIHLCKTLWQQHVEHAHSADRGMASMAYGVIQNASILQVGSQLSAFAGYAGMMWPVPQPGGTR